MSITLRLMVLPVLIGLLSAASPVALAQDHTPLPDRQIQNLITRAHPDDSRWDRGESR